jgi:NAD+-dependent protein deacetylase sirtuin 5
MASQVYPAASYASQVRSNGGKVAIFNSDPSENDEEADFLFQGPCEEMLPIALDMN